MPKLLNLVVVGPPGAGKTTHAERLARFAGVPFLSAGDLLREEVRAHSFKVRAVREKRMHLTIDDDKRNCWAINEQTEALAAHMLPFPETSLTGVVGVVSGLVLWPVKALHRILG